ncbi:hypothetical protein Tco_1249610 [Tanacetum coccineum]
MPLTPDPPLFIQQLLRNNHFMEHIRAYNQMFAMTSFRAKVDDSVNRVRRPYVFKVSSQIYHWIGSLCLEEGHYSRFLQLYIYDTQAEVANRMAKVSGQQLGGGKGRRLANCDKGKEGRWQKPPPLLWRWGLVKNEKEEER